MQVSPRIKKIYNKVAEDLNLPIGIVEIVINSQFKFVKEIISEGEHNTPDSFKTINLTHFGKFAVRKKKLEYYRRTMRAIRREEERIRKKSNKDAKKDKDDSQKLGFNTMYPFMTKYNLK